jgi:AcrR family transcriptional regulator
MTEDAKDASGRGAPIVITESILQTSVGLSITRVIVTSLSDQTLTIHPDDQIRSRLVTAAAEVFAESGYDGARVAEIAARAGLTTGAIYNRFSGKSELLFEAIELHTSAQLRSLLAGEVAPTDILVRLGSGLLTDSHAAGQTLLLEAIVAARRDPDLEEMLRFRLADVQLQLAKVVTEAKAAGSVDPNLDTNAVVALCQGLGLGIGLLQVTHGDLPTPTNWDVLVARLIAAAGPPADLGETE